jgi:subtilisin family serine protease
MVAGLAGARAGNGIGGSGICARCSVMPVRVIGRDGRGGADDVAAGLRWAVDHGAHVVNFSFVLSAPDAAVEEAIRYAQARGAVVVSAAGNNAETSPVFPAAAPGVVSVAATDESNAPYAWSGRGAWVRVAAPGCAPATVAGGSYATICGTSAATAVVSGVVALALSARPGAGAAQAVRAVEAAAAPIGEAVATGRVDAAAAVSLLAPPAPRGAPAEAARVSGRPLLVLETP